jgi:hypothetical protein
MFNSTQNSPSRPTLKLSLISLIVMRSLLIGLFTLGLFGLLASCSHPSQDLVCPLPESGAAGTILGETPAQIAIAGDRLGAGSENDIAISIASIKARHPKAAKSEIVNYLVTGYCPKIQADRALDLTGKQSALRAFSVRVSKIAEITN